MGAELRQRRASSVADAGLWAAVGLAAPLAQGFVAAALLARLLPPAELGRYLLAMSVVAAIATLGRLGLARSATREVAAALALRAPGRARAAVGAVLRLGLAGSLLACALGLAWAGLAGAPPQLALWALVATWPPLLAELLRGLDAPRPAAMVGGVLTAAALLPALALAFALGYPATLGDVLLLQAAAGALASAYGLVTLRGALARQSAGEAPSRPLHAHLSDALPQLGVELLWLGYAHADLWIMAALRPPAEVAVYAVATRVARLLQLPQEVSKSALAPRLAALWAQERRGALEGLLRRAALLSTALALLGCLIMLAAGGPLLRWLFGPGYAGGAPTLVIASLAAVGTTSAGLAATTLTMAGYQRVVLVVSCGAVLVAVLLALALAPAFGGPGVAFAIAAGVLLQNGLLLACARRLLGVWTFAGLSPATPGEDARQ